MTGTAGQTTLTVTGNVYASNALTTTNLFANTETLTGTAGQTTLTVTGNVYASNALTTTNLFANTETLTGTAGQTTLNVTGNIYASNAITVPVAYISNIYTSNIQGFIGSQWSGTVGNPIWYIPYVGIGTTNPTANLHVQGNVYVSNAVTTTNLFANTETLTGTAGQTTLTITGNIYASNAVTATTHYGNVNASNVVVTPVTGVTGVRVTGNMYASNAVTTTNLFANTLTLTGTAGQTTLSVINNVFVSDTITSMVNVTPLGTYVGGGTLTSVPTRAINTYSTSYPNFLVTGGSQFYFYDGGTIALTAQPVTGFGYSSSMSADGNILLVTGRGSGVSPYVYRFTNGSWNSGTALTAQAVLYFGQSSSMSADGNTILVTGQGIAEIPYVYQFTNGSWDSGTALTAQAVSGFGISSSMSADGNTLVITGLGSGVSPYVYRFRNGSWDSGTALTAKFNSGFGKSSSMSADGNTIVVSGSSGSPYVYRFRNGSWDSGTPLTAQSVTGFGQSTSMSADGNTILVTGSADSGMTPYIYRFRNGSWDSGTPLTAQSIIGFGQSSSMSADGNTILVTGYYFTGGTPYVYRFTNGIWDSGTALTSQSIAYFGVSSAMSADGSTVLVTGYGGWSPYVYVIGPRFMVNNTLSVYNSSVGISTGTTVPTANLHVVGNVYVSNAVTTTNLFTNNVYIAGVISSSYNIGGLVYNQTNGIISISAPYGQGVLLYGAGAGNPPGSSTSLYYNSTTSSLGIGTSSPTSNLHVVGNMYVSNALTTTNVSTTGFLINGVPGVAGQVISATGTGPGIQWSSAGSGTSQGVLYTLGPSGYTLGAAFDSGTTGTSISGWHINLSSFTPEVYQTVAMFSASTGMLKFGSAGLYQLTCVMAGNQPVAKVALGKQSSSTFPTGGVPTTGYDYVYNYPIGSSPSEIVTIPINVTDISQYYYLDVFFNVSSGTPTLLYPTRTTTAVGYNYGTYVQVSPFGNYLSSATGVASGLLANCSPTSNLSGVYSSNAYRVTMNTSNGWTVSGTSTSLAVTANGNFQVNQAGQYEIQVCLNCVGQTPSKFQVGSMSSDSAAPGGAQYLYTYAPMYTQDPTTTISMPVNITNIANVYFIECSFPGTLTGNVALQSTSTFVTIKPIGGYISSGTNPWIQQGTSVYYNGGPVGIGVVPTALTETFTVSGNTSFVSNVTVTSDVARSSYVTARRVPAGSLAVSNYITGRVPLTTTTNLIQNYLSNAAAVVTSAPTYNPALSFPGTTSSSVNLGPYHSAHFDPTSSNIFVEAWVYVTAGTGQWFAASSNTTISTGEDWGFLYNGTTVNFYVFNTAGSYSQGFATGLSQNGWYHVAGSWNSVTKTAYAFVSGAVNAGTAITGSMRYFATNSITIGSYLANTAGFLKGYIYDMRILKGSIVPVGAFTGTVPGTPAVFGLTAPSYVTNMNLGGSSNVVLSLQSQYFPGASTAPYGPVLTLPGTAGSYYCQPNILSGLNWKTYGFTCELWVNYATFATANTFNSGPQPFTIMQTNNQAYIDWSFGATITGQLCFWFNGTGLFYAIASPVSSLVTGQWTHLCVQTTSTALSVYINGTIQTLTQYNVTGGTPTASAYPAGYVPQLLGPGVGINQGFYNYNNNFAIARARIVYGTASQVGNVYNMGGFTVSPNFGTVPVGATVIWQLESQYPLPTYSSIQDVTQLPQQASSYGSLPLPVGGVTSNILGPYPTTYPQLDSIRFDGTGYIDYGNAATSVMTTNLWATPWTIEAWVYLASYTGSPQIILSRTLNPNFDFAFYVTGYLMPGIQWSNTTTTINNRANSGLSNLITNSWTHVAVTFDGVNSNVYFGGTLSNSMAVSSSTMWYTPNYHIEVGSWLEGAYYNLNGNLADVRVSNVARYTGSSYTVPNIADGSGPFTTDRNTLLLLKSLSQQTGTTLQVQGRGTNAVSLGATRTVQSYPPAPMSSYLLDTTGNTAVTYGQGKYVASASSEYTNTPVWRLFDKTASSTTLWASSSANYSATSPYGYYGSVTTVDTLGNSYPGEWVQIQTPNSILLSSYAITAADAAATAAGQNPGKWWVLGSRDGINWTLIDSRSGVTSWVALTGIIFTVSATQSYNYYRIVGNQMTTGANGYFSMSEWTLNGTEESLCVTNDAKVGIGIANPQRSLEVAGDLVVGGTISGGAGMGSFRNRIINGDMRIDQRNSGSAWTGGGLSVDRWSMTTFGIASGFTQQRVSVADLQGYNYALRITIGASTLSGTGAYRLRHAIEGYNIADLYWGTSQGVPVTVSFWVKTSVPGVYTYYLGNKDTDTTASSTTAQYVTPFTVFNANAWEYKTITIPPPPNGTSWSATNSLGISSCFIFYENNSSNVTSTANWYTNSPVDWISSSVNLFTNPNATWQITGVQLEKGTVATPFEFRPYATELALCQRYYQEMPNTNGGHFTGGGRLLAATNATSGTNTLTYLYFTTPMRAAPTPTYYGGGSASGNYNINTSSSGSSVSTSVAATSTGTSQTAGNMISPNLPPITATGGSVQWVDMGWGATLFGITLNAEL